MRTEKEEEEGGGRQGARARPSGQRGNHQIALLRLVKVLVMAAGRLAVSTITGLKAVVTEGHVRQHCQSRLDHG